MMPMLFGSGPKPTPNIDAKFDAKFFRDMKIAGIDFMEVMKDAEMYANLVEYVKLGCPKISTPDLVMASSQPEGSD